jgi:NADH dehydrogenase FAD-containing subunit
MFLLRERFQQLRGRAREGVRQRVVFAVARHNRYPLPLYEVALMLDTWLRRERVREHVELGFVTGEASFVEAAGPRMHEVIEREFAERGIEARAAERVVEVRAHESSFAGGGVEPFDLLVAAPPHRAALNFEALPADEHGFVRVESATRQVLGHPEIYAPGDGGDFPLKDGFLALLQADAAAHHIAAVVRGARFEHPFEPISTQIVDMLDKAAFAQLALETTDDPDHPVRLRSGAADDYKVGVSRAWRAAKRTLSSYLVMQFAAAEPFRTGPGWRFMDLGVRAMTGMLAE